MKDTCLAVAIIPPPNRQRAADLMRGMVRAAISPTGYEILKQFSIKSISQADPIHDQFLAYPVTICFTFQEVCSLVARQEHHFFVDPVMAKWLEELPPFLKRMVKLRH